MRFAYDITDENGAVTHVVTKPSDLIRLERRFEVSVGEMFMVKNPKLEHVWFLAWCALKRENPQTPEFDEWMDTVGDVEANDPEDDAAPLG